MIKLRADVERFCSWRGHARPVSTLGLLVACANPRLAPVVLLRLAEAADKKRLGFLAKIFAMLNVALFGLEVSPKVAIGGGLLLPHTVGTVIGAARIGDNCTIMQGVTLGTAEPEMGYTPNLRPTVGDEVLIGAGAKVLGSVAIGNHARIGANAVVVKDVPPRCTAVGVPATIRPRPPEHDAESAEG
jgi:serine O-acetyltransferase